MLEAIKCEPFAFSLEVQGRPSEIEYLREELVEDLADQGWQVVWESTTSRPLSVTRLERGKECLNLAVADPSPSRLVRPHSYLVSATGSVDSPTEVGEILDARPFTPLEVELIGRDMGLTSSIERRLADWLPTMSLGSTPLEGHGAIFTIHHQTDFVLLLEMGLKLGLDPTLITVIDKEYKYRHSRRVDSHIRRRMKVPVFTYSEIDEAISDHIRRVSADRSERDAKTWRPTLVIDDGGYLLPRLLEKFEPFLSLFKGVVEQTKSGIWKLRPYDGRTRIPLFSVAESDLKSTVEATGVAKAAFQSLRNLMPNEKFDGRRAVVVGFGVIGQALADLLRKNNLDVSVVDRGPAELVTANERGFPVSQNLKELVGSYRPRYIFSCAPPGAVGKDVLTSISADCVLISLTSRDEAFDKAALEAIAPGKPFGTVGTIHFVEDCGCRILLLADGFPVNFHFSESMPNQQSDLVMASLLVGAVSIAQIDPAWPTGESSARANDVLNEGTLLDDFLSHNHPIAPE
jgi:S-adenosylhomocysteine hydrolase